MPLIFYILFYFLFCLVIDVHTPAIRLALFPMIWGVVKMKPKVEAYLEKSNVLKVTKILMAISIVLGIARTFQVHYKLTKKLKHVEDIALLNRDAVETLFDKGKNPYKEIINTYNVKMKGGTIKNYGGYKYPPLQIFYYAPFVKIWNLRGIHVGNLIIYLAFVLSIFLFFETQAAKYLGLIFFLGTDYFFTLAFNNGTNDFLPTLFLFWFVIALKKSHRFAWIMHGFSLLSKQLPGALMVFFFPSSKKEFKGVFLSLIFATIGCLPFLAWDFTSFFENTVEFAMTRPVRESSLFWSLPHWTHKLITPFILICALITRKFRFNIQKNHGFDLYVICLLMIFLVPAKMSPTHYFVWLTPFLISFFCDLKLSTKEKF